MIILDPKTLPQDELVMYQFAVSGKSFAKKCILTLLRRLRGKENQSTPEIPIHNPATSGPTLSHITPNGDVLHVDALSKVTKEEQ